MTGQRTQEEIEKEEEEDRIIARKYQEAEKSKTYINFFNKDAIKLMSKSKKHKSHLFYSTQQYIM